MDDLDKLSAIHVAGTKGKVTYCSSEHTAYDALSSRRVELGVAFEIFTVKAWCMATFLLCSHEIEDLLESSFRDCIVLCHENIDFVNWYIPMLPITVFLLDFVCLPT